VSLEAALRDDAARRAGEAQRRQSSPAPGAAAGEDSSASSSLPAGASSSCIARQAATLGVAAAPVVRGPIVYAGTPAEVLVFARGDDDLAVVVDHSCRLLVTQFLHPGS
jgi:hypothetical protein